MRGDFCILLLGEDLFEELCRFLLVAQAELDPGLAVENERIFGRVFESGVDQRTGLLQIHAALGERVAQRIACVVVVGLALDDLAQQALHLGDIARLLGEHGLFVDQIVVVGSQFGRLAGDDRGLGVLLGFLEQLRIGQQLALLLIVGAGGQRLDQRAGLGQLALLGQQRCLLHAHRKIAGGDLVGLGQPVLSLGVLRAIRGDLRGHQIGTRQRLGHGGIPGVGFGQLDVALQRGFGGIELLGLDVQRSANQPCVGQFGVALGEQIQLFAGLFVAGGLQQKARIVHAHFGAGVAGEIGPEKVLRAGCARIDQLQRQRACAIIVGVERHGLLGGIERARRVVGSQTHASHGGPRGRAGAGVGQLARDSGFHDLGGECLVADSAIDLRQRLEREQLDALVGQRQFLLEQAAGFCGAIEDHQNLQQIAVGVARIGEGVLPGACRDQGAFCRTRLQRDLGGALIKLLLAAAPCRVQHQRVTRGGIALPGGHLAHEQLVEKLRIHGSLGVARRLFVGRQGGGGFGRGGCLCPGNMGVHGHGRGHGNCP